MNNRTPRLTLFPWLALLFILLAASPQTGFSKEGFQWKIDDLLTIPRIASFHLSPSGRWLAWTVIKWNTKVHKRYQVLYLTPLQGKGKDRQMTFTEDTFSAIQWVPGEQQISFKTSRKFKDTKPGNLWVMNINGGESRPITRFKKGIQQYRWLDKDTIIFTSREADTLLEKTIKEKKDTSEVVEDEAHRTITRLFTYNLKKKKRTRLTENKKPLTRFFLSHDKKWLVYTLSMSMLYGQDQRIRPKYYLFNLQQRKPEEIVSDPKLKPYSLTWARDNSGFHVSTSYSTHPRYTMASVTKVYWFSLKNKTLSPIDLHWEKYGGRITATRDGFLMVMPNGVYYKHARFYHKGNTWKRSWIRGETQRNISPMLELAKNGRTMIYAHSTASSPVRYYLGELKGNQYIEKREIMDIKSPLFKKPLTKTEIITWKGALDDTIEGILYYPYKHVPGKRYPLIVMIHGGPNGADMDRFSESWAYPAHLMSERGAFCLKVNYHGSSNYGIAFGESIARHYYEYEVPDIEKGIDKLINEGKVDKEKLGIIGWSNGAILGIALTIHTRRYKVASLGAGDVNWTSDYGNCAFGVAFDNYYFGGPPWNNVEHYIKKSPLFQMEKVTTPTLIFHGSRDRAVPYGQGWEYYRALQVIDKAPVRFISFPGEGHGPRKLAHQRRKLAEEIQWFEKYLFKSYKKKNEALKKGSPLDKLAGYLKIARSSGLYGRTVAGKLIPETVMYKKKQVGRFEVTRAQWAAYNSTYKFPTGTGNYPVTGITFDQARDYIKWLNRISRETYRLPLEKEIQTLYPKRMGNTFDYWAGYTLSPGDFNKLKAALVKYKEKPVLLKEVGRFQPGGENLVFDLGGNAAEWVTLTNGQGKACGGSADLPVDPSSKELRANAQYIGFRVIKEGTKTPGKPKVNKN